MKMKSNRNMPNAVKDLTEHAGKVYTRNVFNKFKKSWSKVFHYKVENVRNGNGFQSFVVKSKDDELEKFEVTLDSQTYEGKCECQQFEFVGILCPHILKVFVRLDIDEIPEHFILPRWRQKANKFRIIDSQGLVHDDGKEESEALRLSHMCQEATKLACLAAPSNEAYTIFIKGMNDLFEKIQEVSKVSPIEICANKDNEKSIEPSPSQILLLDPNISQCKGRKKDVKGKAATTQSERLKSGIEMSLNKKKRKCHMCFQFGHDKRTCPSNPMRKTNIGPSWQFLPSANSFLSRAEICTRRIQTLPEPSELKDVKIHEASSLRPDSDSSKSLSNSTDNFDSSVKFKASSNLKVSSRHDLAMVFTCKVCETRSIKTVCRESYEKGVVVARCGGCNNVHLISDHLGWFGEPGSIEDLLAARGEEVKRGSVDTLNLTLEDLAGQESRKMSG
ncbi:hypothetical protein RHGRI_021033 [Rhododendron griersonianum]|uniref:Protein FAR1-RELATED SEQUENCE n=1 Tax=Rhododendron griersonianum TaxID=479676 RepID=A0AAV6JLQ1_9ERIC|nr:hypothetical protein RHGRI_021033 [Rhododendron griersonianum]